MLSVLAIPGLLAPNTPLPAQALAQQWATIYNNGAVLGPRVAMLSLLGYGYLIYVHKNDTTAARWNKFAAAAALSLAIVPFTALAMDPTNQALLKVASEGGAGEAVVRELLVKWKGLNLMRAVFPFVGAVVGLWGLIG